jgi:hypothetical protein
MGPSGFDHHRDPHTKVSARLRQCSPWPDVVPSRGPQCHGTLGPSFFAQETSGGLAAFTAKPKGRCSDPLKHARKKTVLASAKTVPCAPQDDPISDCFGTCSRHSYLSPSMTTNQGYACASSPIQYSLPLSSTTPLHPLTPYFHQSIYLAFHQRPSSAVSYSSYGGDSFTVSTDPTSASSSPSHTPPMAVIVSL